MPRTRYAYVPFNQSATVKSDAVRLDNNGQSTGPAGRLICTVDGADPAETHRETLVGKYSKEITRRDAELAFGREHVGTIRDEALDIALY